ncbi:MAG: leucine/isoleucine/valine transporter permease subunit [Actinomycetota bacterium]|nr:leucine/isoleucine/valine transporter permease subunit [Actinomycetota bacterium]
MAARRWARTGALGGIVTVFLALVGLIGGFTDVYLIGDEVTFAGLMLFLPAFMAGVVASAPRIEAGERHEMRPSEAVTAAAIAGAAAGAVFALAVVAADVIGDERIRAVFLNVSPQLMEFVTFQQAMGVGALIIVVISAVTGILGGALRVAPASVRRPVTAAVTATLLFGFLQRVIPIALDQLDLERDWLYSLTFDGLTWIGALVVAAVAAGISILNRRFGARLRGRVSGMRGRDGPAISPGLLLAGVVAAGLLIAAPLLLGSVISEVLGTVMVFALLGIGLNIVVGYAGLLDLGYVFFFALGAYSLALLTGATLNAFGIPPEPVISGNLNFYVAIPIVMVIAAVAGFLVGAPVLRLRGDYLALVTLGLGEMVTVLVGSPWLVPLVGGPSGMRGITDAAIGGFAFRDPQRFYYLALAFVGLAAYVSWRLASSRIGRAWTAMREDEQTADAMGISTTRFKLLAFAIGGAIGSLGGALFAVKIGSLTPASFQVIVSIQVLGLVILGGMGSIPGVLVGALVLVGLPGLLREFEEYRFLAYGAAVVAVMVLRPQGLVPNVRRSRELKDEESAQDEWAKAAEEGEASPDIAIATGSGT